MARSVSATVGGTAKNVASWAKDVTNEVSLGRTASGGDGPIVGVEHVRQLIRNDVAGGLQFLFHHTCHDLDIVTLESPLQWLRWLIPGSASPACVLQCIRKYVYEQSQRALVYVDTPWIQQYVIFSQFVTSRTRSRSAALTLLPGNWWPLCVWLVL
jgi:hypothetical protein